MLKLPSVSIHLFFALAALISNSAFSADTPCKASDFRGIDKFEAEVVKHVDGDTVKLLYKRRTYNIRFLGIDTPETNFKGKSQGVWADRASEKMKKLLPIGSQVMIEFDEEKCDNNRRLLGYVWKDGKSMDLAQLQAGLAVNYCIAPNLKHCDEYADVVADTVKKKKGIFGDPSLVIPYEWRRQQDGRPYDKFVGSIRTKIVYAPTSVKRVPVAERVFFFNRTDIKPPYKLRGTR